MKYERSKGYYYYLWWYLLLMTRAASRARRVELNHCGTTPEEATILYVLKNINAQATPTEMSRYLLRQPHSSSTLLERMRRKGLIKKHKLPSRRNSITAKITKKGEQIHALSQKRESVFNILSCLSDEECYTLEKLVNKMWKSSLIELSSLGDNKGYLTPEEFLKKPILWP